METPRILVSGFWNAYKTINVCYFYVFFFLFIINFPNLILLKLLYFYKYHLEKLIKVH